MTQAEEFLSIDTPENVIFGYEVAGIGSRFMAAFVDTLIFLVLQLIVYVVMASLLDLEGAGIITVVLSALAFIFSWGYYVFFEMAWNGQTPGKYWVGLRVIRNDGSPVTLIESVIRNLIRPIDFLPFGYAIGLITMFLNRQASRLGDLAAGTLVVYAQEEVTLSSLRPRSWEGNLSRSSISNEMLEWPVERLTSQALDMAQNYLKRRFEIKNPALAQTIHRTLLSQMGIEPDQTWGQDEDWVIRAVITVWQMKQPSA